MYTAKELIAQGYPSGTVVIADYQSEGRARGKTRRWKAQRGSSLLLSLALRLSDLPIPPHQIPLRTGLGVCNLIQGQWGLPARLKWPNDVLVDGKKICGILCESEGGFVVIGMGINCNQPDFEFFPDLRIKATSLRLAAKLDAPVEAISIFEALLRELHGVYFPENSDSWRREITEILYRLNEKVEVRVGGVDSREFLSGRILGINPDGGLELEDDEGKKLEILSGENLFPDYS